MNGTIFKGQFVVSIGVSAFQLSVNHGTILYHVVTHLKCNQGGDVRY